MFDEIRSSREPAAYTMKFVRVKRRRGLPAFSAARLTRAKVRRAAHADWNWVAAL